MSTEHYVLKKGKTYECSLCNKQFRNPDPFVLAKHFEMIHGYAIEIVSLSPLSIKAIPSRRDD